MRPVEQPDTLSSFDALVDDARILAAHYRRPYYVSLSDGAEVHCLTRMHPAELYGGTTKYADGVRVNPDGSKEII